jgi:HSP20 family protein
MQNTNVMPEDQIQTIPVKVYRSDGRLTVAAPMPGVEPGDITVDVTAQGELVLHGQLRGTLKGVNDVLVDEWNPGNYHRELVLPDPVDGGAANVTYGNGVVVVVLPLSAQTRPAHLAMTPLAHDHGVRLGNAGHDMTTTSDLFIMTDEVDEVTDEADATS